MQNWLRDDVAGESTPVRDRRSLEWLRLGAADDEGVRSRCWRRGPLAGDLDRDLEDDDLDNDLAGCDLDRDLEDDDFDNDLVGCDFDRDLEDDRDNDLAGCDLDRDFEDNSLDKDPISQNHEENSHGFDCDKDDLKTDLTDGDLDRDIKDGSLTGSLSRNSDMQRTRAMPSMAIYNQISK